MSEKQEQATAKKPKTVAGILFEYVEMFVFAALAVILLMTFAARICVVSGDSMNVTLLNGERLIVSNLFYTPQKGDIIVFHQTSDTNDQFNEPIVKRVIATGGEFVKVDHVKTRSTFPQTTSLPRTSCKRSPISSRADPTIPCRTSGCMPCPRDTFL